MDSHPRSTDDGELSVTEIWMICDQHRIALSTGVDLDVWTAGDPAAPPIILLHGFPESHRTWRHQIPALAADHFVIAPDQRSEERRVGKECVSKGRSRRSPYP